MIENRIEISIKSNIKVGMFLNIYESVKKINK